MSLLTTQLMQMRPSSLEYDFSYSHRDYLGLSEDMIFCDYCSERRY